MTNGTTFNSLVQNQRGALALLGGKVFVPFGGHLGDCGTYHGWIVGIATTDPTQVSAWVTRAIAGGVWAPGGIASDGTSLFFATGNTEAAAFAGMFTAPGSYQDGESIFRLPPSLAAATATTDYFAPTNWSAMDKADADLGGTGPIVFDVAGATPSALVIGLGKDGNAYLLNRANLGGIAAPLSGTAIGGTIINAAAEYTTSSGTFVVFKGGTNCPSGQSGGLMAIKIGATSPPSVTVAWCGGPATQGSPAVSMSNAQGQDAISCGSLDRTISCMAWTEIPEPAFTMAVPLPTRWPCFRSITPRSLRTVAFSWQQIVRCMHLRRSLPVGSVSAVLSPVLLRCRQHLEPDCSRAPRCGSNPHRNFRLAAAPHCPPWPLPISTRMRSPLPPRPRSPT